MINVAPAIDFLAVPVTLTRRKTGYYSDDGVFRVGAIDQRIPNISAVVQVIRGYELNDLPEGIRTDAKAVAWSRYDIEKDDIITWDGNDYRVIVPNKRGEGGFTRAILGILA